MAVGLDPEGPKGVLVIEHVDRDVRLSLLLFRGGSEPPRQPSRFIVIEYRSLNDSCS